MTGEQTPELEKVEYHLFMPGERNACDWFDDEGEALKVAQSQGRIGWRVVEVTYYGQTERQILPVEDDEE